MLRGEDRTLVCSCRWCVEQRRADERLAFLVSVAGIALGAALLIAAH